MERNRFRLPTFDGLLCSSYGVKSTELRCVSGSLQMFVASFKLFCLCVCVEVAPQRRLRDTLLAQSTAYVLVDMSRHGIDKIRKTQNAANVFFFLCATT